jgi:hypothetical protein
MDHEQNNNTNGVVNNDLARSTSVIVDPRVEPTVNPLWETLPPTENSFGNTLPPTENPSSNTLPPTENPFSTLPPTENSFGNALPPTDTGDLKNQVVSNATGVAQEEDAVVPDIGEEITLKIGKSTLVSLCQNLNTNLLVNIAAYKSVLAKLKDSENDEKKKTALDSNIETLNTLESNVSALLNTVQTNLNIPADKKIDPKTVINEASSSDASSGNFMTKLLGAEAAAILGSMAAATVLMLGGGKYKRRKFTKGRRNKKQKSTKSNKT